MTPSQNGFLFGAVVGSGLTAQAADKAGADYLLALNAGRFRVQGASSLASFLPVRSANDWVIEFAKREMLGRCNAPIFAGLSVSDPNTDIDALLADVKAAGFAGVCNFPSTTSVDGRLSALFEREGLGFDRELALISKADATGLQSFVYVGTNAQAHKMAEVGAQAICVNIGFTSGATGVSTSLTLDTAAAQIDRVLEGIPASVRKLCHGGPITSPEQALAITRISGVEGFVAGSTLDRLPVEQTLEEVTRGFTAIPSLARIKANPDAQRPILIGSSHAMQTIRKDIEMLAGEDIPVLIMGESGTGKTLVAQRLHEQGPHAKHDPIVVDCQTLEPEDTGVQLLGLAAGARGGTASRRGALELAARNSIVFEEIAAIPPEHQGKILRFVEEGTVQRIGDHMSRTVSSRVISTTAKSHAQLSDPKIFRSELYHRISAHPILIPPLRNRVDDIPELAFQLGIALHGGERPNISNAALRLLMEYHWPGNIRELRFAIIRALREKRGKTISQKSFSFLQNAPISTEESMEKATPGTSGITSERDWIAEALGRNGYRRSQTALELGMTTRTLYNKIKKYNLQ